MSTNLHAPDQAVTDAQAALNYLKEGNKRFTTNSAMARDTNKADINVTKDGQKPFAVILTCADSRVSPEIYFDQKIGDIFTIRNAGNFAGRDAQGSIEYAVEHLHSPLVVVTGHTKCGAISAAFDKASGLSDNLQGLIDNIQSKIDKCTSKEDAVITNVEVQVETLKNNPVIKKMNATVVGAEYDISTGEVKFL